MVLIDLETAFDTINHRILCNNLKNHGVQDRDLAWFVSNLSKIKPHFRVNGLDAKTEGIEVGVPQGSCLGPLHFFLYIIDLSKAEHKCTNVIHAGDNSLCYKSNDLSRLDEAINKDL